MLLLLPRAGGVKPTRVELRIGKREEKRGKNKAQGAGGRAARTRGGGGWGSTVFLAIQPRTLTHPQGLGAVSRWGVTVLANAGASPHKSYCLW